MSHMYADALTTQPEFSYITYSTSRHEQNGDIINFAHFEEVNLV